MRGGIAIRTLAAGTAALALVTGCAEPTSGGSGDGQSEVQVVVVPEGEIIPVAGGVDIPQELADVITDCERQLDERAFDELAMDMARIAEETDDPAVEAGARLCGGIAEIDMGEFDEGLDHLDAAEDGLDHFPPEIRRPLAELLHRGQTVGHASTGNDEAAQESLDKLAVVAPDARDDARDELCRAAPENAACAPAPTGESTPSGPTEDPTTPTETPSVPPTS